MNSKESTNPRIAAVALKKLREASERIPSTNQRDGLGGILREVKDANKEISKCEKNYQEKADILNKTIAHSISNFVDKELIDLEADLKNSLFFNPNDEVSDNETYERLMSMKEKLIYLFELVSRWGWSHLRQVQKERIAEIYEKIDAIALKIGKGLEEKAIDCSDSENKRLMQLQTNFQSVIDLGSDKINPDEIFAQA